MESMPTFKSYLDMKESMDFDQMIKVHENILENADIMHQDFLDTWKDIVQSAIKYTGIRAEWNYLDKQKKGERDEFRSDVHNEILINFILLERIFKMNSWNCEYWTTELFLQGDVPDRKRQDINEHRQRVGDFANYLAFVYAVNGR